MRRRSAPSYAAAEQKCEGCEVYGESEESADGGEADTEGALRYAPHW